MRLCSETSCTTPSRQRSSAQSSGICTISIVSERRPFSRDTSNDTDWPLAAGAGEGGDVRDEHVGREYRAQVTAEIALGVEVEQVAVAGVGVHELAHLFADRDDEGRLGQGVEHHVDVGRHRRPPAGPPERAFVYRAVPAPIRRRDLHAVAFPLKPSSSMLRQPHARPECPRP